MAHELLVVPLSEGHANEIITWNYQAPYDKYTISDEEDKKELLDGSYYGVLQEGELIGYFCYGVNAQVPNKIGAYDDTVLTDIGLGMRPDLCGLGRGNDFLDAGMKFGRDALGIKGYRLSVISRNERAIRLYEKKGFEKTLIFDMERESGVRTFQVMVRDELHRLKTDKIAFKGLSMDVLDEMHGYASNELVSKYIGWQLSTSMSDTKKHLDGLLKRQLAGTFKYASVVENESGKHIGTAMVFAIDQEAEHAEIGYVIGLDHWNKGYGTAIVNLLKTYAFETLKINKLFARVVDANQSSSKILMKNGFELEAVLKDYYKIDGVMRNCEYYTVYHPTLK